LDNQLALLETGSATNHQISAKIWDDCTSTDYTFKNLKLDVVSFG
jgi:hypothetical protein